MLKSIISAHYTLTCTRKASCEDAYVDTYNSVKSDYEDVVHCVKYYCSIIIERDNISTNPNGIMVPANCNHLAFVVRDIYTNLQDYEDRLFSQKKIMEDLIFASELADELQQILSIVQKNNSI
jgi:hypothetical protein